MQEIKYIPVRKLWEHPDNPRKDIGDITELTESIRENGVLQNLTVVPLIGNISGKWDGETYRVVIGHRRLAAAKKAGLETVPCVVVEMTQAEQVKTMLIENMQRSDLTVYEQAQGFQLMLDMGETVETIAQQSGFSTTTVRRRVKLLELDQAEFKKSEARGATLQDYIELEKIEDPDRKNAVLKSIGTANFKNNLKSAIEAEEVKKYLDGAVATVSTFATLIEKAEYSTMERTASYDRWNRKREVEVPEDSETARYYYIVDSTSVTVYRDREDTPVDPEVEAENARRQEAQARHKAIEQQLQEMADRHFALRCEFVRGVSKTNVEKHMGDIVSILADAGTDDMSYSYYRKKIINDTLFAQLLGIDNDGDEIDFAKVSERCMESPKPTLLAFAFSMIENPPGTYFKSDWSPEDRCYKMIYKQNDSLDKCYALLEALGYEMSDEEQAMQGGTHELLREESDNQEASDDE